MVLNYVLKRKIDEFKVWANFLTLQYSHIDDIEPFDGHKL